VRKIIDLDQEALITLSIYATKLAEETRTAYYIKGYSEPAHKSHADDAQRSLDKITKIIQSGNTHDV
jgi:hypothetical protein